MVNVSLFASAVRPKLWESFLKSFEGTSVDIEVVFAGNSKEINLPNKIGKELNFKYILTENIKPAQCYEIARRGCTGECIMWVADDCEFPNDVVGKAYNYWKSQNNEKLILSIQTKESGYQNVHGTLFNMNNHRFFGGDPNTPLMAPLCLMSRKFLNDLGGYDQRYVSGQTENDILMRAYTEGAICEIFGNENCFIDIDHLRKSIEIGECTNDSDFRDRPFAKGYEEDRSILQRSWCTLNNQKLNILRLQGVRSFMPSQIFDISPTQLDEFQPYPSEIPLDHSLSNKGIWD